MVSIASALEAPPPIAVASIESRSVINMQWKIGMKETGKGKAVNKGMYLNGEISINDCYSVN